MFDEGMNVLLTQPGKCVGEVGGRLDTVEHLRPSDLLQRCSFLALFEVLEHHAQGLHRVDEAHDKIPADEVEEELILFAVEPFQGFSDVGDGCDAASEPFGTEGLQEIRLVLLLCKKGEGLRERLSGGHHTAQIVAETAKVRLFALAFGPEGFLQDEEEFAIIPDKLKDFIAHLGQDDSVSLGRGEVKGDEQLVGILDLNAIVFVADFAGHGRGFTTPLSQS